MAVKTVDSDIRRVQNEKELEKRDSNSDERIAGSRHSGLWTGKYSQ